MGSNLRERLLLASQEKKRRDIYKKTPSSCRDKILFLNENKKSMLMEKIFYNINLHDIECYDVDKPIDFFKCKLEDFIRENSHLLSSKVMHLYVYEENFSELLSVPFVVFKDKFSFFWALGLGENSKMKYSKFILIEENFQACFSFFRLEHNYELIFWSSSSR